MAPAPPPPAGSAAAKGTKGGEGGKKQAWVEQAKEGKQQQQQQGGDGGGMSGGVEAVSKANVDVRVRKLAASLLLQEDEGFLHLAAEMEQLRQRPPPGHDKPSRHGPDSGAVQEMRGLLAQTSSWCASMEQEALGALGLFKQLQEEEEGAGNGAHAGAGGGGEHDAGGLGGLSSGVPTSSSASAFYAFQHQQLQQQQLALEAAEAAEAKKKTRAHGVVVVSSGPVSSAAPVAAGGGAGGERGEGLGGQGGKGKVVQWKRLQQAAVGARAAVLPHLDRVPEEGDQAAAKISYTSAWALSRVVNFNMITDKVEVMDVEDAKQRTYVVDRAEVALLPREQCKEVLTKHYPKYSRVFAQYPETTSFYPAMVVENNLKLPRLSPPGDAEGGSKGGEEYHALLWFDEDEDEQGQPRLMKVPLRLVTAIPEAYQGEGLG